MSKRLPVCKTMCPTCPFRTNSKYKYLADDLARSALNQSSRICHSTGSNGIHRMTGKPERLCRGARDIQLQFFAAIKFIESPTDEAWDKKCKEMNL